MNISELYFNNYMGNTAKEQRLDSGNGFGFVKILETANNAQKSSEQLSSRQRQPAKQNNTSEQSTATDRDRDRGISDKNAVRDNTQKNDTVRQSTNNEAESSTSNKKTEEGLTSDEKKAIDDLAEATGVPEEVIMQILAQLNISPLDLAIPENMNLFMQKLFNVESSIELLLIEDVHETLKALKEVVENFPKAVEGHEQLVFEESNIEELIPDGETAIKIEQPLNKLKEFFDNVAKKNDSKVDAIVDEAVELEVVDDIIIEEEVVTEEIPMEGEAEVFVNILGNESENTQQDQSGDSSSRNPQQSQSQGSSVSSKSNNTNAGTSAFSSGNIVSNINNQDDQLDVLQMDNLDINPAMSIGSARAEQLSFVRTEAARSINTQDIINQIVDKMKVEIKGDVTSEIKITLKPEHLGDVTMKIATQNGIVTAQFVAENQRVKEIIEAGFNQLREALQEQGINVSQLSVSVGQDDSNERRSFRQEYTGSPNSRRINNIFDDKVLDSVMEEVQEARDLSVSGVDYRV